MVMDAFHSYDSLLRGVHYTLTINVMLKENITKQIV